MPKSPTELELSKSSMTDSWNPSDAESKLVTQIEEKFSEARTARETSYDFFGGRSPEQYWKDSERRWLGLLPSMKKKAWQSRVVRPITRNKCIGVIAHLLSDLIKPDFFARRNGMGNETVARAVRDLYEISEDLDKSTLKYLLTLVDAVSYGTAFVQEDYIQTKQPVKDVKKFDPITGEITYKERDVITFDGFQSTIVSPFEIYLGDIFCFEMEKQPYIFRRTVVPYKTAQKEFGHYKNWKHVMPGNTTRADANDTSFFSRPFHAVGVNRHDVEILRATFPFDDQVVISINRVLMTPVGAPNPYDHKKFNVVKVCFEPLNGRCAYGKSMPDKLMGEQDVVDTLYRMIVDKTYLSLFPPLFSTGSEGLSSDIIEPGLVTPMEPDAKLEVPKGVANGVGNELNLLNNIENSMENSSIDKSQLGSMASGERSATQVNEASSGAKKLLGLFAYMISFMIEDQARLRVSNIFQFWPEMLDKSFENEGKELPDGSTGSSIVRFAYKDLHPTSARIFLEEQGLKKNGKNARITYLDPDEIRAFEMSVRVKANPSDRLSPALEKAMALEYYNQFIASPYVDGQKLTRSTIRTMGKNPQDIMKTSEQMQSEAAAAQAASGMQPVQQQDPTKKPARGSVGQQMSGMLQPKLKSLIQA